ncbi:Sec-independent protein translocase subunit TatA [Kitasatospora sp. NPDC059648]|uniref:Sec-independent protein translocase subunit TatA n=1 Tax=Kitasatospora sp. NPDC059648 TaxID=3346894 RepID=UPI0036BCB235
MLRNGLEPWHVLVMVTVLVLLFGSRKLPEMARGLGKSMRILKAETAAMREDGSSVEQPDAGTPAPTPPAVATATLAKADEPAKSGKAS